MKRSSGVLMHVSTLYGEYSCGSFGKEALAFIDFLADSGFSYWQVLPFGMTDAFHSPYQSLSAFGGNPYFIDLPRLREDGLLTADEVAAARQKTPYSCEFERLGAERLPLLRRAAARADAALRARMDAFLKENPYLEQVCRFMALRHVNGDAFWATWTVDETGAGYEDEYRLWQFIEYEFFTQWQTVKEYAASRGISLLGDIPIYVSLDSADVWANRHLFRLNPDGSAARVAGVPPDYFCEDGQLWGNPLYDWDAMKQDGYRFWQARIRHMLTLFDGIRIDHFRGFASYWSVPGTAKTAREGRWEKGPGKPFIDAIKAVIPSEEKFILAEDLGEMTPDVAELVAYSGFPGMRVFQFAFLGGDNPHLPHNYIPNCIAYSGTHDNNTLLGYVWEQSPEERAEMLAYIGYTDPNWDACYPSIVRCLFESAAGVVILPVQDLLFYGADTRLNTPGRAEGNWQYRITRAQLEQVDRAEYRRLNRLYRRKV